MEKKLSTKKEIIMRTPRVVRNNRVVEIFDVMKIGFETVVIPEIVKL